jgi:hypothetical protein
MAIADEDVASLRFDDTEEVWVTRKYLADIVRDYCKCNRKSERRLSLNRSPDSRHELYLRYLPDSPFKSIATLS